MSSCILLQSWEKKYSLKQKNRVSETSSMHLYETDTICARSQWIINETTSVIASNAWNQTTCMKIRGTEYSYSHGEWMNSVWLLAWSKWLASESSATGTSALGSYICFACPSILATASATAPSQHRTRRRLSCTNTLCPNRSVIACLPHTGYLMMCHTFL
jgi:hypothetical protein